MNFAGQVVVNFDVFDGASFTPGSASLMYRRLMIFRTYRGDVSGIIIPEEHRLILLPLVVLFLC